METIKTTYKYISIEKALEEISILKEIYTQNNIRIKSYQLLICKEGYNLTFYLIKD